MNARLRLAVAVLALAAGGCSLTGGGGNLLGGRDKCWPQEPPRAASIWRGVLQVDADGSRLATPDGEAIPLWPGSLTMRLNPDGSGDVLSGDDVVARAGDDVTLFGGAGADGYLVVCAVEENRGTP